MAGRVLVVQHEDDAPPAWFGDWLEEAGAELDVRMGHRGDAIPDRLQEHDALLVLGGEMGANDDADHPWLTATKALIAQTASDDKPFLGICLGHQLATVALGGTVTVNPSGLTVGLTPVSPTPLAADDPLIGEVRPGARAVHWNSDIAVALPSAAVVLATSPDGAVQAVRFGPLAWGVQFHPEASPAVFESWIAVASESARPALYPALAEIAAAEQDLRDEWGRLARSFAAVVGSSVVVP